MRPLKPALPGKKRLTEHAAGVLIPLGSLWIPVTLDRLGTIRERVLVEDQPLAPSRDGAGFRVDGIDPVRGRVLLVRFPSDVRVEGFISGAVFGGVSVDGVEGREDGS